MNSGCAAALDRLQDFCFMAIKAANREPCTPPRSTLILTPAFVVYTELGIDPLIRILNVDANTIFYSAPRTETPKLDRLMRLVSTCTEYEAHELIRIVNDILNIMRHSENEENAI